MPVADPRLDPRYLRALRALEEAVQSQRLGRHEEADLLYAKVLKKNPEYFDALNLYGLFNYQQGKPRKALELLKRATRINPRSTNALNNLGVVLCDLQLFKDAFETFERAMALDPANVQTLNNRGNVLAQSKRLDEALASFDRALKIQPDFCDAYVNRGRALVQLGRYEDALANYDRALSFAPSHADLHHNRGGVLQTLYRLDEALASYDRALAVRPHYAPTLSGRGTTLHKLGRHEEALSAYDQALKPKPDLADAWLGRGDVSFDLGRYDEAFLAYDKALALASDRAEGIRLHTKMHLCDWRNFEAERAHLLSSLRKGTLISTPFAILAIASDPSDQLKCAADYFASKYTPSRPLRRDEAQRHDRIRLAYISADFYNHATSHLAAGLFEAHRHSGFETYGVSIGPARDDDVRRRLLNAFDRFLDVGSQSDEAIAQTLRNLEIDIAVDLKGFTAGSRPNLFAQRVAPVQLSYLGYPGTMGASCFDYILADRIVIPETERQYFSEKVAYLPDSYQVNDNQRKIAETTPTRADALLPQQGFVFCSFNNSYKITPDVFDVWMRLLRATEQSVLWLLDANPTATNNLRAEAEKRGISADRLVFAPRVKLEDHLARHRLADLFLDTLPCNAHTTASDALWAGLPVLTCLAPSFAGRVAGSLLSAVGLPELVTTSLQDYEALALGIAQDPALLAALKAKLARNRDSSPLFNTERSARHIEAAYKMMWERHQSGEPPASFAVAPVD